MHLCPLLRIPLIFIVTSPLLGPLAALNLPRLRLLVALEVHETNLLANNSKLRACRTDSWSEPGGFHILDEVHGDDEESEKADDEEPEEPVRVGWWSANLVELVVLDGDASRLDADQGRALGGWSLCVEPVRVRSGTNKLKTYDGIETLLTGYG
jgi:hypothetical protein